MTPTKAITAIIPTSPLMIHPSTEIMDETYVQLQKQLPGVKLLILADGVHPEEEYLRERYEGYLEKLHTRASGWRNTSLYLFKEWKHQSGMLRQVLDDHFSVTTPLVFWSEHDIPLRDDYINWQGIVDTLLAEDLYGIRFELTGDPLKQDETKGSIVTHGVPVVLSTQFVNWPQVFRLDYIKDIMVSFGDSKTYLECAEYDGIVRDRFNTRRYGIYSPEGDIRRCYHSNGREHGGHYQDKPYIIVNGRQRHIYDRPYRAAE